MLTDVLYAIIAFETLRRHRGPKRRFDAIAPIVHQLALTTLGLASHGTLAELAADAYCLTCVTLREAPTLRGGSDLWNSS
jgi:hypothetical protein